MNPDTLLHETTGEGESMVLVPGGLSGWISWIPHAKRLTKHRKVIRTQLKSIERAEAGAPFPEDYGTHTEREALRATLDELGLDSVDLVGWSHGGHVALAFTLEHPERVRTLTVIEPASHWIHREIGRATSTLEEDERNDRSFAGQDVTLDDLKGFLVRVGLGKPGDDFESMPLWPTWARNRRVLTILGTLWDDRDSLDRLKGLDVPVLGVKGTASTEDNHAVVDTIVASVPHGRVLELPGGHACHVESIDRFLEELEAFVDSARRG